MNRQPYQGRPNHGDHRSPQTRPQPPATQPQKKTPAFEAGPVRLVDNAGSLRAYVSVKIGPLVVHDFRVIQQPEQDAWVSVPQKSWNTPEGKRQFSPLLDLPPEWKQPLMNAVIAAWRDELQKQQQQATGGAR